MAQDSREQVFNGCFNGDSTAGWFGDNVTMSAVEGEGKLKAVVPGGTTEVFKSIVGQEDIVLRNGK